jgi:uncharacterized membrane protein
MDGYELLLFLHVSSVVLWLGTGTTLALLALHARRARDGALLERMSALGAWFGPRVFAPASFGTLGFGIALVADGHWGFGRLWVVLGLAAFAASSLVNAGVRLPLMRRLERGVDVERSGRVLARLPLLDLAVLYLAVADMVAKPTVSDTATLATGGGILALAAVTVLGALR